MRCCPVQGQDRGPAPIDGGTFQLEVLLVHADEVRGLLSVICVSWANEPRMEMLGLAYESVS